jgi:hypothetical protein
MAKYDTVSKTINEITVTLSKEKDQSAGGRLVAFLKWLSENTVDPGYGVGGGNRPDQGLPGQGGRPPRPDQGLPGGGGSGNRPDQGLPGGGERPDQGLPPGGSGGGEKPDQGLPGGGGHPDQGLPPRFTGENAEEIAKAILAKCFQCETSQPKK